MIFVGIFLGLLVFIARTAMGKAPALPEFRFLPLLGLATSVQLWARYWPMPSLSAEVGDIQKGAVIIFSYVVLIAFLLVNLRVRPVVVCLFGVILNFLAIASNGGFMPVDPQAVVHRATELQPAPRDTGQIWGKSIVLDSERTRLAGLTDVLRIPGSLGFRFAYSVGDVFIVIGGLLLFLGKSQGWSLDPFRWLLNSTKGQGSQPPGTSRRRWRRHEHVGLVEGQEQ